MGDYDEGAPIPGLHAAESGAQNPNEVRLSGAWKNPPDWKGRWCWMGTITVNPPQTYEIGMKRGKPCRIPIPASKQRERPTPDLVFVGSHHEYLKKTAPNGGYGWLDASRMPMSRREMIVDAFGEENLNETQREICGPVLRARAEKREARKRVPLPSDDMWTREPTRVFTKRAQVSIKSKPARAERSAPKVAKRSKR